MLSLSMPLISLTRQLVRFHYSTARVKFDGEDGSGPGVNRGFFASLANELKSSDLTKQPMNRLGQFFYEPGKKPEQSGLYAPCPFSKSGLSLSTRHSLMVCKFENLQYPVSIEIAYACTCTFSYMYNVYSRDIQHVHVYI